jgi:DNA-binding Xre family transcriptional regulator
MVNGHLISKQRIALKLTRHDLAKASGLSWQALEQLEDTYSNHDRLPLSCLSGIAGALGLKPSELLDRDHDPRGQPQDAAIIGRALAAHPEGLHDDVLARALQWPTQRVRDAIATLADQLPAIGQTLRRVHGHSRLAAAISALDPRRTEAIARAADPLDPDHARVLLRVLRGHSRNGYWKEFTAAERDRLMCLINQGVLVDEGGTAQPSLETREALIQGRRTAYGNYPHASRFRTPPTPDSADR